MSNERLNISHKEVISATIVPEQSSSLSLARLLRSDKFQASGQMLIVLGSSVFFSSILIGSPESADKMIAFQHAVDKIAAYQSAAITAAVTLAIPGSLIVACHYVANKFNPGT